MTESESDTVINKIKHVEFSLKNILHRIEMIEQKLKTELLTIENREKLENELEEVKMILRINEEKLQSLRKENTKSFMVAASLIFLCFLFYGVYMMIIQCIYDDSKIIYTD